jgi:hypothetical protein
MRQNAGSFVPRFQKYNVEIQAAAAKLTSEFGILEITGVSAGQGMPSLLIVSCLLEML